MEPLLKNIDKNDDDNNRKAVEIILTKLKKEDTLELLGDLCDIIYEKKISSGGIEALLEPFDEDEDLNKVVIKICREFLSGREQTRYIVQTSKNLSDIMYMLTLLFTEIRSSDYQMIAENLLYCYDHDLTNEDIDSLLENLEEYERDSRDSSVDNISCYLKNKRPFDKENYKLPYWVSIIQGENIGLLATVPLGETEDTGEEVRC